MNRLYYGDNLHVLRDAHAFPDASVDLICIEPPFNSKRDYNLLFKSPKLVGRVPSHGEKGEKANAASGDAAYNQAHYVPF